MRMLRILLPLLIGITGQAAAQSVQSVAPVNSPAVQIGGRAEARPAESVAACGFWQDNCPRDDRNRMLLLLGLMSVAKRPSALR